MADGELDLSENVGNSLVATCVALLTLTWIAVALRTYTRAILTKSFQIDDWLVLVAQAVFTTSCAFVLHGVEKGMGRHNDAIRDDDDKVAALMMQALAITTYIIDMMFIKLSIGIFLLRLSVHTVYRRILIVSLVVVALWSMGVFLWAIFQCTPVEKQWDFRIETGYCASPGETISAAYAISVMTVLTDWLYALLPIAMLWNVQMTKQAKATVILVLGLGIFASIATLIRLKFLPALDDASDLLFTATDAMVWTLVEPGVAIVASSLATIRPLLRLMKIRGFQSTDSTSRLKSSISRPYALSSTATATRGPILGHDPNAISLRAHPVQYRTEQKEDVSSIIHVGLAVDEAVDEVHEQDATGLSFGGGQGGMSGTNSR